MKIGENFKEVAKFKKEKVKLNVKKPKDIKPLKSLK